MPTNDIATTTEGDLVIQGGALKIATDRVRDRHLIVSRVMTIQGEIRGMLFFGVPSRFIGGPVDPGSKSRLEAAVREALAVDGGLLSARPTVKGIILGYDRMAVLIQSNRQYEDAQTGEKLVVSANYYTMDDMPTTKMDGELG